MPANKARARVFAAIVAHCLPPKAGESPLAAADQWLRITPTQLAILRQWAAGRFKADWRGHALDAAEIPDAPSRRDTIDRAVLDACAGGVLSTDPDRDGSGLAFLPSDPFRLDPDRMDAGAVRPRELAAAAWPAASRPRCYSCRWRFQGRNERGKSAGYGH